MTAGEQGSFMKALPALMHRAGLPGLGLAVVDGSHIPAGTRRPLWAHAGTGQVQFFGVQTAGSAARDLLGPAEGVEVDAGRRRLRLPYARAQGQAAPAYAAGAELTPESRDLIYLHDDVQAAWRPQSGALFH